MIALISPIRFILNQTHYHVFLNCRHPSWWPLLGRVLEKKKKSLWDPYTDSHLPFSLLFNGIYPKFVTHLLLFSILQIGPFKSVFYIAG